MTRLCQAFVLAVGASVGAQADAQCPADLVPDGRVDGLDLGVMLAYWGPTTALELSVASDLNHDTVVDGADLGILLSRWGFCRPVVTTVSPATGCFVGGTTITVSGSLLAQVSAVTVGGVPCTGVVPLSSSTVRAITPPGAVGPAAIRVTTPGGTATAPTAFTYAGSEVTGISPGAGSPSGGTAVVIGGRFLSGTAYVTIGGVPATEVVNVSETQVRAITPPGKLGTVDVAVTGPKGTAVLAGGFTYRESPPPIEIDMTGWQTWGGITAPGNSSTLIDVPAGQTGVQAFAYASLSYESINQSWCSELRMRVEIPGAGTQSMTLRPTGAPSSTGSYVEAGPGTVAGGGTFSIPAGTRQLKVFVHESYDDEGPDVQDAQILDGVLTITTNIPPPLPSCTEATSVTVGSTPFATKGGGSSQLVTTTADGLETTSIFGPQWFTFIPPVTGHYEISLCGSIGDTKIAIGDECPFFEWEPLTSYGYNDDSCGCTSGCAGSWSSRLDLVNSGLPLVNPLQAGRPYRILVGGFGPSTGPVSGEMVITQISPYPPP